MRPSFLGLMAGGFLILIALIVILLNYQKINQIESIYILLLLCIAISTHSLLHSNEEIYFKFNPLVGKWKIHDVPQ